MTKNYCIRESRRYSEEILASFYGKKYGAQNVSIKRVGARREETG
jgi:hypothetical protein